jgi:uncharacterized membrane protein YkoI
MSVNYKKIVPFCLVLLVANSAFADSDYDRAQQLREAGEILPLETILQKLHTRHPGKVLEVELENEHGQVIYEIEILDDKGKVREIKVNAKTGEQLQQEKDD